MGDAQQASKYQKTSTKRSTRPASKQEPKKDKKRSRPRPRPSSSRWTSSVSWVGLCEIFFCNVCCLFVCLVSSHKPQLTQICSKSIKSTKLGKSHKARFWHFHTFPGSCLLLLVSRDLESKNSRKVRQKLGNAVKDRLTFCWCRRVYVYSSRSRLVSDVIIAVRRRTPRQCRNNRRQLMEVAIHPHDFNIVFLKSNCLVFG